MKTYSLTAVIAMALCAAACGNSNPPPPPEQTGQACTAASECFSGIDGAALQGGAAVCLDRVPGGYCTHFCSMNSHCCAVPGECRTSYPQVCAPFESTGNMYCFLSCEDRDLADAGVVDADAFCATYAWVGFKCRSTGGGSQNRKVCVP